MRQIVPHPSGDWNTVSVFMGLMHKYNIKIHQNIQMKSTSFKTNEESDVTLLGPRLLMLLLLKI